MAMVAERCEKQDRRRRNAGNPSVPISVNLPLRIKQRLDNAVIARGATRNGIISQALTLWLDAQEATDGR